MKLEQEHERRAEEAAQNRMALMESEERFRRMAEQAGVGVVIMDKTVSRISVN